MKIIKRTVQTLLSLLLIVASIAFFNGCATNLTITTAQNIAPQFKGKILVASDADQIGTAYGDGVVNKLAGIEDSLTLITFNETPTPTLTRTPASNSVISWPAIIGTSPDGHLAYIAETRKAFTQATDKVKSVWEALPQGEMMTVVDIATGQIVQQKSMGLGLGSASVNAKGDILVTTSTKETSKEIVLATLKNGLIDSVFKFPCTFFNAVKPSDNPNDFGVKTIEFSPIEDVLAVNMHNKAVVFYQVKRTGSGLGIEPVGQPLSVANNWSVGNWTPSGKHFIVTDVNWGTNPLFGATLNKRGSLVSVRFDKGGNHQIVSKAEVGLSPEGFDISPDGRMAVAVNMRRTYLPQGLPFALFGARNQSSLSLVSINPETGELALMGDEYGFEGELPEDAIFDTDSKSIAVAIFNNRYEAKPTKGFIEFWRIDKGKLIRTSTKVAVTRGSHCLKLVK